MHHTYIIVIECDSCVVETSGDLVVTVLPAVQLDVFYLLSGLCFLFTLTILGCSGISNYNNHKLCGNTRVRVCVLCLEHSAVVYRKGREHVLTPCCHPGDRFSLQPYLNLYVVTVFVSLHVFAEVLA